MTDEEKTAFVSFADLEAAQIMQRYRGYISTGGPSIREDGDYILELADRIRTGRRSYEGNK